MHLIRIENITKPFEIFCKPIKKIDINENKIHKEMKKNGK